MNVCMHVCMCKYVCMYVVCTYVRMYYVYMQSVCTYVCMYVCVSRYVFKCICMHVYIMLVYRNVCIYARMHPCILCVSTSSIFPSSVLTNLCAIDTARVHVW
jgi:hypothetical protein